MVEKITAGCLTVFLDFARCPHSLHREPAWGLKDAIKPAEPVSLLQQIQEEERAKAHGVWRLSLAEPESMGTISKTY